MPAGLGMAASPGTAYYSLAGDRSSRRHEVARAKPQQSVFVYFLLLGRFQTFDKLSSSSEPEAGMHYSPENPRIPDDQTARAHRSIFVDGSTSKSPSGAHLSRLRAATKRQ